MSKKRRKWTRRNKKPQQRRKPPAKDPMLPSPHPVMKGPFRLVPVSNPRRNNDLNQNPEASFDPKLATTIEPRPEPERRSRRISRLRIHEASLSSRNSDPLFLRLKFNMQTHCTVLHYIHSSRIDKDLFFPPSPTHTCHTWLMDSLPVPNSWGRHIFGRTDLCVYQ